MILEISYVIKGKCIQYNQIGESAIWQGRVWDDWTDKGKMVMGMPGILPCRYPHYKDTDKQIRGYVENAGGVEGIIGSCAWVCICKRDCCAWKVYAAQEDNIWYG